jgi:cell division protein FtsZ
MASGKRASMREGPLAQLFRKTEEDESQAPAKPRTGRPLPEDGPSPQATRQVPEPQAQNEAVGAPPAEPAASADRAEDTSFE